MPAGSEPATQPRMAVAPTLATGAAVGDLHYRRRQVGNSRTLLAGEDARETQFGETRVLQALSRVHFGGRVEKRDRAAGEPDAPDDRARASSILESATPVHAA